ncbi:MAG: SxtJ family membrane protein [Methylocystis sp.]|uniref:SxtJ family membrane protein n=1 Tax=Methylocystis sp. TaxID=1911079 RepID=UPI003D11B411
MSHEDFSRDRSAAMGSDRSFGLVIAAAIAIISALPLWRGETPHYWGLAAALGFAAAALLAPAKLRTLNRLWHQLGLALHKITNPIIMGVLFFGVILPIAIVFRLRRVDPLKLSFDKNATTYWTMRDTPEAASDMSKQF